MDADALNAAIESLGLNWGIFEADGSEWNEDGKRPYQLQKVDFPETGDAPESDLVAVEHMEASILRADVMNFLFAHSPAEYEDIVGRRGRFLESDYRD